MSDYKNDPMKQLVYKHDVMVALNMNIDEPIDFVDALKNVPVVDVAEVRHGHWIDAGVDLDGAWYYRCSVCGSDVVDGYEYPLCPYCGARMDGEKQEHEDIG